MNWERIVDLLKAVDWELIVYLLVAGLALLPLIILIRLQRASGWMIVTTILVVLICLGGAVLVAPPDSQPLMPDLTDNSVPIKHLVPTRR